MGILKGLFNRGEMIVPPIKDYPCTRKPDAIDRACEILGCGRGEFIMMMGPEATSVAEFLVSEKATERWRQTKREMLESGESAGNWK